jgi:secreted PhoX family phosphatase
MLGTSAATGIGIAAAGVALSPSASATPSTGASTATPAALGRSGRTLGALVTDPKGLLSLAAGFSYTVVSVAGETTLTTGEKSPGRPDGTGAFRAGRAVRLVQNHELSPGAADPVPTLVGTVFDAGIKDAGGCTVIEVARDGARVSEWVGLSGTISNCAGGVTPWDTWLTCEETEVRAGTAYGANGSTAQDHGWIFEVAPAESAQQHPVPIKAFGRYAHEAVVVMKDMTVYLTEDASSPNGLLYRWTGGHRSDAKPGFLQSLAPTAGTLEAMRVQNTDGQWVDDLSRFTSAQVGRELKVAWVKVPDRLATTTSVRKQFTTAAQVTRGKKLEGAWADARGVYFASSYAGYSDIPALSVPHDGQIWYLDHDRQTLTLQAYFPYIRELHTPSTAGGWTPWTLQEQRSLPDIFDGPDNVHVSPWGGLVIAEDGEGLNGLFIWTEDGGAQRLARNDILFQGTENAEMTGPTFSPDGSILFANVQEPGHTYAIHGDFRPVLS